jgi:hypothetical protein
MHTPIPRSPDTVYTPPRKPKFPHAHHLLRNIVAAVMIGVLLVPFAGSLLLAFAAPSPAKAATMIIPGPDRAVPPSQIPAPIHTVVVGGTPGWQIALIAAGTAVLAAILAVAADRVRAARRHAPAPSL